MRFATLLLALLACSPPSPALPEGDLRPLARELTEILASGELDPDRAPSLGEVLAHTADAALTAKAAQWELPAEIRVWRRGIDGSEASCDGRVDVLAFDDYVAGVLPAEWDPRWEPESLAAGAIVIRTYAAWWVNAGGKYDCADVDDTTWTQVYDDDRWPSADDAVAQTAGLVVVDPESELVYAEYSAENGDPTAFGVDEPLCTGQAVYGHGRGMCQWGSQRWAEQEGKDAVWMAEHYYPDATVISAETGVPNDTTGTDTSAAPADWWLARHDLLEPLALDAGERASVAITWTNLGNTTWPAGTEVSTSPRGHHSVFAVKAWLADDQPLVTPRDVVPGQSWTARFDLAAPDTGEAPDREVFTLNAPAGFEIPGAEASLRITVAPAPKRAPGAQNLTGEGCDTASTTASLWLALAGAALVRRRTR